MFRLSLLSWIAFAAIFLVLGLSLGNATLLTGAVFVLLSALLATALSPPSGIRIDRSLPRSTCWTGDTITVNRQLIARGGIGAIFVHDRLPDEAQVARGSNLRVVWKWPGKRTADLSYELRFPKRGRFVLDRSRWESQAAFGVRRGASGRGGASFVVNVVPGMRSVSRLNEVRAVTRATRSQDDIAKTGASTNEFRELRLYQPGDPMKRINWKASARGARGDNLPLVNELEPESRRAVWTFLDVANYMDVGVPLSNPLENTVEASGVLAQYFLSKGSTLGAYAYNTSGGAGELLPPESGRKQFRKLVFMLTSLKPGRPREDLLQAVERCKDFLFRQRPEVFVITRLDVHYPRPGEGGESLARFRAAVSRLTALRARSRRSGRVRVIHVALEEPEVDPRAPDLTKWETRFVAGVLRKAGASVIEWKPAEEEFTSVLVRHMETYG